MPYGVPYNPNAPRRTGPVTPPPHRQETQLPQGWNYGPRYEEEMGRRQRPVAPRDTSPQEQFLPEEMNRRAMAGEYERRLHDWYAVYQQKQRWEGEQAKPGAPNAPWGEPGRSPSEFRLMPYQNPLELLKQRGYENEFSLPWRREWPESRDWPPASSSIDRPYLWLNPEQTGFPYSYENRWNLHRTDAFGAA